jgi:hypothetical protein
MDFVREFATSPKNIIALLLGGDAPSLHGAIQFTRNGGFSCYVFRVSIAKSFNPLLSLQFMYHTPQIFCSVRWALLLLVLLEWADARTGKACLSW